MPADKNGNELRVGDVVKVAPIEKPDVMAVGPIHSLLGDGRGLIAWTRLDCTAIEKAHFYCDQAELVHAVPKPEEVQKNDH